MYKNNDLEIWNLTPGVTARYQTQSVFNINGHVNNFGADDNLYYSLNNSEPRQIFVQPRKHGSKRLLSPGDFNIDTICSDELKRDNRIEIWKSGGSGIGEKHAIPFSVISFSDSEMEYHLNFDSVKYIEQLGQVVDGRWQISSDECGNKFLEISREHAGYDRLLTFGNQAWTTRYEITSRIEICSWVENIFYNVGLLFKWNPHLQGNGHSLPLQWSTGLGYYASKCPGLRIRFGIDVHTDSNGNKLGSHVLNEKPYSPFRRWIGYLKDEVLHIGARPFAQLPSGQQYFFKLRIHPSEYSLTVWRVGQAEPSPQVYISEPPDLLPKGAVGIIALNCALRVYQYDVRSVD